MSSSTSSPQIVLTGVTGKLGGLILSHLLQSLPPASIGVSVRDPSKVADLAKQGVHVRQGTYDDLSSLTNSFAGAETVLIVSSNDRTGKTLDHHRTAFQAAKSAGVKRVYYTSHQAASATSSFWPCQSHFHSEKLLKESGLDYVILRNGFYMDSLDMFIQGVQYTGVIAAPKDGKVSWTAHEDLARATAALLLRPAAQQGKEEVFTLAGDEALDMADVARVHPQVHGKEVTRTVMEWEAYQTAAVASGAPEAVIPILKGFYEAAEKGEFYSEDVTLKKLVGGDLARVEARLAGK